MQSIPPSAKRSEIFAPNRRFRSAMILGGFVKATDSNAERGRFTTEGTEGTELDAAATLVNRISVGVNCTDVTEGRAIGGYEPRAFSRCTTSASPAGSFDASCL